MPTTQNAVAQNATTTCTRCTENEQLATSAVNDLLDPRDVPTTWWDCQDCGTHLERYRGGREVSCHQCGAQYNASGQRLRDDWADNPAWRDDDLDDLAGYELEMITKEHP